MVDVPERYRYVVMKRQLIEFYKSFSGNLELLTGGFTYPKDELIVLCMHSTPADQMNRFKELVSFLLKHFKPLSPNDLPAYYRSELKNGPYILFSFDDGLKNNLHVASYLQSQNVFAFFFLVPDFIESNNPKEFYRKNIRQVIDPSFDKLEEDFIAMNAENIQQLLSAGHSIGSHTMSHLLRANSDDAMVVKEVKESGTHLQHLTGQKINSFCSPIDTLFSINAFAKKTIEENYTFHFTTFPGLNSTKKEPNIIFRRNIEVNWSYGKIKFALGQWDLRRWLHRIQDYRLL